MINSECWRGSEKILEGFKNLFDYFQKQKFEDYIFRGQDVDWVLKTTLERACENSGLMGIEDSRKVEDSMIRQFKRVYDGDDRDRVEKDTLYSLSMMRHYGAPTRLLDFTYSKYVGIYFALECANDSELVNKRKYCAIWCINNKWLRDTAKDMSPEIKQLIDARGKDETRNDTSFTKLYLNNKFDFVGWENPLGLHRRLHTQQGLFLCPGNVRKSFMDNLKQLKGWDKGNSITKVICRMSTVDLRKAIEECRRMNISRESLFPGLDGFAQSMRYHLYFYKSSYDDRTASA
jgi:hypothetical protein